MKEPLNDIVFQELPTNRIYEDVNVDFKDYAGNVSTTPTHAFEIAGVIACSSRMYVRDGVDLAEAKKRIHIHLYHTLYSTAVNRLIDIDRLIMERDYNGASRKIMELINDMGMGDMGTV